jgi:hypothetical protein
VTTSTGPCVREPNAAAACRCALTRREREKIPGYFSGIQVFFAGIPGFFPTFLINIHFCNGRPILSCQPPRPLSAVWLDTLTVDSACGTDRRCTEDTTVCSNICSLYAGQYSIARIIFTTPHAPLGPPHHTFKDVRAIPSDTS